MFDYTFTGGVHQALNHLGISQASAQATATLSASGFTATLELDLGRRADGVPLISTKSGFHAYLDTLSLTLSLSPQEASFEAGGTGYLVIPPLATGGTESHLDVDLSGSLGYDLEKQVVTAGLHFALRAADGPWTNALGIAGLQINGLAATFGATIPLEGPIPLPTIDLAVSGVSLPHTWAAAIGMTDGAQVSAAVNIDVAQPLLDLSIEPAAGTDVALRPFAIVRSVAGTRAVSDDFVNSVEVGRAHRSGLRSVGGTPSATSTAGGSACSSTAGSSASRCTSTPPSGSIPTRASPPPSRCPTSGSDTLTSITPACS